jgi:archaellum component FlaC
MAKIGRLNVQLGVDLEKFRSDMGSAFKVLNSNTAQMKRSLQGLQASFKVASAGVAVMGAAIAATGIAIAGSKLVEYGKESVKAFNEAEAAASRLRSSLVTTGRMSQATYDAVVTGAQRLAIATLAEDDAIISATAKFANFAKTLTGSELADAERAIIGLSTVMGVDLETAAAQLGKTVSGASDTIGRTGISISKTTDQHQRLKEVLQKTNPFLKTAEDLAKTSGGQMANFGKQVGEVNETIGGLITEGLDLSTTFKTLTDAVITLNRWLDENYDQLVGLVRMTSNLAESVFDAAASVAQLAGAFVGLAPSMDSTFSAASFGVGIMKGLGAEIYMVTNLLNDLSTKAQLAGNWVSTSMQNIGNSLQYGLNMIGVKQFQGNIQKNDAGYTQKNIGILTGQAEKRAKAFGLFQDFMGGVKPDKPAMPNFKMPGGGFGGGGKGKKGKKSEAEKELERLKQEAKSLTEAMRTPWEVEKAAIADADKLFKMHLIGLETYQRKIQDIKRTAADFNPISSDLQAQIKSASESILKPAKDFFDDFDATVGVSTAFEEVQKVIEATKTPLENYNDQVKYLNYLHEQAGLSTEVWQRALQGAQDDLKNATKAGQEFAVAIGNVVSEFGDRFFDTFIDGLKAGKFAFKDFVASALEDIAKLIFKMTVTIPIADALAKAIKNIGTSGSANPAGPSGPGGAIASAGINAGVKVGSSLLTKGLMAIPKLFGFADGGSFVVGGTGGIDSQTVAFKASPNERVTITKPGQDSGGGGVTLNQYITLNTIDNRDFEDRLAENGKFLGNLAVQAVQRQSNRMGNRGPMERSR